MWWGAQKRARDGAAVLVTDWQWTCSGVQVAMAQGIGGGEIMCRSKPKVSSTVTSSCINYYANLQVKAYPYAYPARIMFHTAIPNY